MLCDNVGKRGNWALDSASEGVGCDAAPTVLFWRCKDRPDSVFCSGLMRHSAGYQDRKPLQGVLGGCTLQRFINNRN